MRVEVAGRFEIHDAGCMMQNPPPNPLQRGTNTYPLPKGASNYAPLTDTSLCSPLADTLHCPPLAGVQGVEGTDEGWALPTNPERSELAAKLSKIIRKRLETGIHRKDAKIAEDDFLVGNAHPTEVQGVVETDACVSIINISNGINTGVQVANLNPQKEQPLIPNPQFIYAFRIAPYDNNHPLIIDPVIEYSTYLGGSDNAYGLAADSSGYIYVTGITASSNYPIVGTTTAYKGNMDVFVTKLGTSAANLVYSTYLGGSTSDLGYGIAVDSSGYAYVTGYSTSNNYPVVGTNTPVFYGLPYAFVTKIGTSGSNLEYSIWLQGTAADYGSGIDVDSSGYAYVTGYTSSNTFPIVGTTTPHKGGGNDAFVTKVSTSGSNLVFSTIIGGSGSDIGYGINVDGSGNAYITGYTTSSDYPIVGTTTAHGGGSNDAFVTKLDASGTSIEYSTYLGGSGSDIGYGIVVDNSGNAYVPGDTASNNFPIAGTTTAYGGNIDAFISKITFSSTTAPTVTTGSATSKTLSSAMLTGTVNPNSATSTTWFEYGVSSGSYTGSATAQTLTGITTTSAVYASLSGLTANTTYYYRAAAQNSAGTSYGSEVSFTLYPKISAGGFHSLAVKSDGTTIAWGKNEHYQLADSTKTNRSSPVNVSGISNVIAVSAGSWGYHSVALKADGTVWAWGNNSAGQLGDGTTVQKSSPVQVSSLTGIVAIATGSDHVVALKSDGTVWAWGQNDYGQLGDGTTTNSNVPVQVSGLAGIVAIEAGDSHSIALKSDGTVWAWGKNGNGQLGDGTTTNSTFPVQALTVFHKYYWTNKDR